MVEAEIILGSLEAFLDGPAQAGGAGQLGERDPFAGKDEVVGTLLRFLAVTPDQ